MSSRTAALLALLLGGLAACRRPPAGTCVDNIDCPPGYDCRGGACAKRPPAPGAEGTAAPPPVEANPTVAPSAPAEPAPEATRPTDAGAPAPPAKRKAAPAPQLPPPATPPTPPSPDPGRLPLWKQRLKNS